MVRCTARRGYRTKSARGRYTISNTREAQSHARQRTPRTQAAQTQHPGPRPRRAQPGRGEGPGPTPTTKAPGPSQSKDTTRVRTTSSVPNAKKSLPRGSGLGQPTFPGDSPMRLSDATPPHSASCSSPAIAGSHGGCTALLSKVLP